VVPRRRFPNPWVAGGRREFPYRIVTAVFVLEPILEGMAAKRGPGQILCRDKHEPLVIRCRFLYHRRSCKRPPRALAPFPCFSPSFRVGACSLNLLPANAGRFEFGRGHRLYVTDFVELKDHEPEIRRKPLVFLFRSGESNTEFFVPHWEDV